MGNYLIYEKTDAPSLAIPKGISFGAAHFPYFWLFYIGKRFYGTVFLAYLAIVGLVVPHPVLVVPIFIVWLYLIFRGNKVWRNHAENNGYEHVATVYAPYGSKALWLYETEYKKT